MQKFAQRIKKEVDSIGLLIADSSLSESTLRSWTVILRLVFMQICTRKALLL